MENLINITNGKLNNWYENVKFDYNVIGSAKAKIENGKFIINYTENGVKKEWSMDFYPEYLEFGTDYFYNVWMEETS